MEFGVDKDEVKQYLDAWYMTAHEACWRLLEREIYTQVPAVMALPVHEKNHQTVSFDPNTDEMTILDRAERAKTKLMAYFEANQTYPHAQGLLYLEFPEHFVWKAGPKIWTPCQRGFSIGCLHFASPSSGC